MMVPICFLSGSYLKSCYSTPRNNNTLSNAYSIVLTFVLIRSSLEFQLYGIIMVPVELIVNELAGA
jgi:hypothetical protein